MPKTGDLEPEQAVIIEAAAERLESARRAVDLGRRELGAAMRKAGLAASARHLGKTRQWALQLAQGAETPMSQSSRERAEEDLIGAVRRLGLVEPILAEVVGDDGEFLRILQGQPRLQAAYEAGMSSIPVMIRLTSRRTPATLSEAWEEQGEAQLREAAEFLIETARNLDAVGRVARGPGEIATESDT